MGKTLEECVLTDYNPELKYFECVRAYRCDSCNKEFGEVVKKVSKKPDRKCPYCKTKLIVQIMGIGHISVRQEATTIGMLAERNTKKMGQYEKEAREYNHYESRSRGQFEAIKESGLIDKNTTYKETQDEEKRLKKIGQMTPEQKTNYILKGDT